MKWWEYGMFLAPWMLTFVWAILAEGLSTRSVLATVAIQVYVLVAVQVYAEWRGYA